jgi:hypothetical protein
LGVFAFFTPNPPVSVLVSLLSLKIDQAIDRRGLVFRREMGVPHDHLKCPAPEQLCKPPQIHPGHNKSTGKRVAVAMPRIWSLEGVAFYQFPIVGESAIIRCHGPHTINLAINESAPAKGT